MICESIAHATAGTHIETEVHGKRELKILEKKETYRINSPKLLMRFLPFPGVDWVGNVKIRCQETGLEADLDYRANTFFRRPSVYRSIKGRIYDSSTSNIIYEIDGHWDRHVTVKDVSTGRTRTIYDAKEALSGMKPPIVKDLKVQFQPFSIN